MLIKLDDPRALPLRAHPTDAGVDLFSALHYDILPGSKVLVDTGFSIQIPAGWFGMIVPRSSMGKLGIRLANTIGIIDPDYRGNIKVFLENCGNDAFSITAFETRVAQLLIIPVFNFVNFEEWDGNNEDWFDTKRGAGGFGSTG